MANLTLSIGDETLRRARIRALEQGTSVNALVREFIESYAGVRASQEEAAERILEAARRSTAGSGPAGRRWTREDLYEERLERVRE